MVKKVLNVGGNSKSIALPPEYEGWEHVLLDIDPKGQPDVCCDARELLTLPKETYDSVYCSHNLEHYFAHDVKKVLKGFAHVLKKDGFAYIRVPDMWEVFKTMVDKNMDIEDKLYDSPAGEIKISDVIYGYGVEIEKSGQDFFGHKTGFTKKSLINVLNNANFSVVYGMTGNIEIKAIAFLNKPTEYTRKLFSLPRS